MAKRKKNANKKSALTQDQKTTPVEKIMNGKVQKLRINIKRLPLRNLNKAHDVKLRPICDSCNNILCNSLPAQCNVNQKGEALKNELKRKDRSNVKSKGTVSVVTRSKARTRGLEVEKHTKLYDEKSNQKDITIDRQEIHPNFLLNNNQKNVKLRQISGTVRSSDNKSVIYTKNCSTKFKNCEDLLSPNLSVSMIVIDDNKRKNFKKLSLTKPLKKMEENNRMEKIEASKNQDEASEIFKSDEKKNNKLCAVKQVSKLSLRRRDKKQNKNITPLGDAQFEIRDNSLICFQPARNSTLLNGMKHENKENANAKNKTSSLEENPSRNLANKSDEIEQLLNSLDDEEEILMNSKENKNKKAELINEKNCSNKSKEIGNESLITKNKSKFFHREKNIIKNNFEEQLPAKTTKNNKSVKNKEIAKKRLSNAKRSTIVRREKIYEFLSQSQTSDSDVARQADPTADIIKKLIDQGKVRVATNCKGKGKPKLKPAKPKARQKIKNKTNKIQLKNNFKKVTFAIGNKGDPVEEDLDFEDHFDNDEYPIVPDDGIELQTGDIVTNALNNHKSKELASEQEGTFSRLARSVLINQAGRSNILGKSHAELLKKNINLVSTPKNKKMQLPQSILETDLSPIAMPTPRPATKPSPWRVNEDTHLPTTFNFSRSSGNLPSFSSDFIPSTPRKENSKVYQNWSPNKTSIMSEKSQTISKENDGAENVHPQRPNFSDSSAISSFSSNDSNAENMPPDRGTFENYNENESIFNLKHLPNPRRALNCRSPLKTINIIEVVQLPPYKHPNKINAKETLRSDHNLDNYVQEDRCVGEVIVSNAATRPKDDLFGFEDYLSQTQSCSQENIESCDDTAICRQNRTIYDKLHDLRKLKPEESELEKSLRNSVKSMPLFDEDGTKVNGMRQRGIKEMLCSTLIHPEPSTSKEALRQLNIRNLRNTKRLKFGNDTDVSELFKDLEPETTFNENEAHRTYIRPYKRTRRLRENKYVVYLDSDESEDENSHENEKRQHSKESNSSSEHPPKKKRQNREPKKNPELIEFVEEFNKLCKEVDSYQLIVEKST